MARRRDVIRQLFISFLCVTCTKGAFRTDRDDLCSMPDNGMKHFYPERGVCYLLNQELLSQPDARKMCEDNNRFLVTVDSSEVTQFVMDFMKPHYNKTWIGLNDDEAAFHDGTPVTWTSWRPGEPAFANETCVLMVLDDISKTSQKWNDIICGPKRQSVCQAKVSYIEGTASQVQDVFSGVLIESVSARSAIECAKLCLNRKFCFKYVFSSSTKTCHLYRQGQDPVILSAAQRA